MLVNQESESLRWSSTSSSMARGGHCLRALGVSRPPAAQHCVPERPGLAANYAFLAHKMQAHFAVLAGRGQAGGCQRANITDISRRSQCSLNVGKCGRTIGHVSNRTTCRRSSLATGVHRMRSQRDRAALMRADAIAMLCDGGRRRRRTEIRWLLPRGGDKGVLTAERLSGGRTFSINDHLRCLGHCPLPLLLLSSPLFPLTSHLHERPCINPH